MKFIKYAVGLVIALSVIPLVVVTVNNLDKPKLTTVTFEVVDVDDSLITFSENTYNNIHALAILDDDIVMNLITTKLNGIEHDGFILSTINTEYYYSDDLVYEWEGLSNLNQVTSTGLYQATLGDKWEMTFEVPRPLPPLVKTLVGFAPLLLIGGVLLFMLNKRKLD